MSARFEVPVDAVDEAQAVVQGADVISCATNALEPAFDGNRLEPGQLVTSIVTADQVRFKTEVDETSYVRADVICINDKESVFDQRQHFLLDPIEQGRFTWDKVRELGHVVRGSAPGRERPDDLILYHNNTGMGIQFAAAGAVAYRQALQKRVGQEVPTEWFGADLSGWYQKGYV
jgi:ornithine cyclodeaminase/alanine dehydrogenase-like protein (mu-crystallin family)